MVLFVEIRTIYKANQWQQNSEYSAPFDPWLRTHWRLGAQILRVAPVSMVITGTVAEWEEWSQMRFPESGSYIVPGTLVPITIDRDQDLGSYIEPNVWMRHSIPEPGSESAGSNPHRINRAASSIQLGSY